MLVFKGILIAQVGPYLYDYTDFVRLSLAHVFMDAEALLRAVHAEAAAKEGATLAVRCGLWGLKVDDRM